MNTKKNTAARQCGAMNRQGRPCKRTPAQGAERCNLHGGKSLRGQASATYKTGKHSKYVGRAATEYETAWNNPRILELTDEIALLDMRVVKLLEAMDGKPSVVQVRDLILQIEAASADLMSDDAGIADVQAVLANVRRSLQDAIDQAETWVEIGKAIEQRRKMVETERKQAELLSEFVHRAQLVQFIRQIADASAEIVTDRKILDQLLRRYRQIGVNEDEQR